MLTYVYFGTNNLKRAIAFYSAVLAPLDMRRCETADPEWDRSSAGWGIYGEDGAEELAFWVGKPFDQQPASGATAAWSRSGLQPGPRSTTFTQPHWRTAAARRVSRG
jgi:hypothetical protein